MPVIAAIWPWSSRKRVRLDSPCKTWVPPLALQRSRHIVSAGRPAAGPALVPAAAWEIPPEQPAGGTPKWPPFAPPNIARSSRGGASRDTSVRDRPRLFSEHGLLKWQGRLKLEAGRRPAFPGVAVWCPWRPPAFMLWGEGRGRSSRV